MEKKAQNKKALLLGNNEREAKYTTPTVAKEMMAGPSHMLSSGVRPTPTKRYIHHTMPGGAWPKV
jgi:hypothetical protein